MLVVGGVICLFCAMLFHFALCFVGCILGKKERKRKSINIQHTANKRVTDYDISCRAQSYYSSFHIQIRYSL